MELISIDYKDWFINQKRLPDKTSQEHGAFFEFHKEICLNGCMMDGVYINPFLYWHLNIWNTEVDIIDERGRISQKYMNPYLRDNEWVITNEIDTGQIEKKGLVILGLRRLAKSVIESASERGTMCDHQLAQPIVCRTLVPTLQTLGVEHHRITRLDEVEFICDRTIQQAFKTQAPAALILSPLLTNNPAYR